MSSSESFVRWKRAVGLDEELRCFEAGDEFSRAAQLFFDASTTEQKISKALFEYSTLMDAFGNAARARGWVHESKFAEASESITRAAEIFRSTVHFAFMAPYISACITLETAADIDSLDEDCLQAYKSAIALFEQSKIALSFRDENHPLMSVIDAYLKMAISGALGAEGDILERKGSIVESSDKHDRSAELEREFRALASRAGIRDSKIRYFPLQDCDRASDAFLLSYPEGESMWILNLGKNPARIESVGNLKPRVRLDSLESIPFEMKSFEKGKIRVTYVDLVTNREWNEGCLTLI